MGCLSGLHFSPFIFLSYYRLELIGNFFIHCPYCQIPYFFNAKQTCLLCDLHPEWRFYADYTFIRKCQCRGSFTAQLTKPQAGSASGKPGASLSSHWTRPPLPP